MHARFWKSALKFLVLGVVTIGLVCEIPIIQQTSMYGPKDAYCPERRQRRRQRRR